jgi:hypothetical protein
MKWELIVDVYEIVKKKDQTPPSPLWKVLVDCYQKLWKFEVTKAFTFEDVADIARNICKVIQKDMEDESQWEKKVKKIAALIKEFLKQSCQMNGNHNSRSSNSSSDQDQSGADDSSSFEDENTFSSPVNNSSPQANSNPLSVPKDVSSTFGNLSEIQNPDKVKAQSSSKDKSKNDPQHPFNESTLEEFASTTNFGLFSDVLSLFGYGITSNIMAIWYRGQARNLIQIRILEEKPGGSIPGYPITWRIGDPIEQLDMIQTLLVSPIIVPNMTTRKWENQIGPGQSVMKQPPDLMVVLDSSGSMGWYISKKKIEGAYHLALLAAFASLDYVLHQGCYVSAINFSSSVLSQKWTNNPDLIERVLLQYQGGGTNLPVSQMLRIANDADRPILIVLISDLEMDNWEDAMDGFMQLLSHKHKLVGFFINGNPKILETSAFQSLTSSGAHFYVVNDPADLIGLVITEVRETYG